VIDAGTHGALNWVDLSTPDAAAAATFYRTLLGWTFETSETPFGEYFVGSAHGRQVGGIIAHGPELRGTPATWTTFFFVDDLDVTLGIAADAAGTVVQSPLAVPGDARVAIVTDPSGAMLGLISGPEPPGIYVSGDPGSVCWVELLTRDPGAVAGFYGRVFGWVAVATGDPPYTIFELLDEQVAGMMMMPDEVPAAAPAHWAVYFGVPDCGAAERTTATLGGRVLHPTTRVAAGSFAVLADPQGATFHVMETDGEGRRHLGGVPDVAPLG
jgi:predicted enzyme related to lactoylglutathione lyase